MALAGCHEEAHEIYNQLLPETVSKPVHALVYNNLAALAAAAGDMQSSHGLLKQALDSDPQCEVALEAWAALGFGPASSVTSNGSANRNGSGSTNLPIYGFMHVGLINHWHDIVEEQLLKLHVSGLWDRTERIFVGLVGPKI